MDQLISQYIEKSKALLFDLDGTLADSMPIHNKAWIQTLAQYNCKMTDQILQKYAGVPNAKTVEIFNQQFGWSLVPEKIAFEKEEAVKTLLHEVQPIWPVKKIVEDFHQKIPMTIVSGGSLDLVEFILGKLQMTHFFDHLITAESTPRGKPAPDPFLKASELVGVPAQSCLVFEDGEAGIQGARAAGMKVVRVMPDFSLSVETEFNQI